MSESIHPRAIEWKRDGRAHYMSKLGPVWMGITGAWHTNGIDKEFRTAKQAMRALEDYCQNGQAAMTPSRVARDSGEG